MNAWYRICLGRCQIYLSVAMRACHMKIRALTKRFDHIFTHLSNLYRAYGISQLVGYG